MAFAVYALSCMTCHHFHAIACDSVVCTATFSARVLIVIATFYVLSSSANICFQLLLVVTMGDSADMTLRQFVETVSACRQFVWSGRAVLYLSLCQVDETREGAFIDDIITILEVNDISALSHLKHVDKIPTESGTSQGKKVHAFGRISHSQCALHV